MGAILSLTHRGYLNPDHILYGLLSGSSDTCQVRLKSRRLFVSTARNLLNNLARLGICASEWTNHKWKMEYCENVSLVRAFVPGTGARPVGMGLPRAAWVKLNRLWTGIGRFHSSMHKWCLSPSPNCECGASKQTANHVLRACPIHRAPHGARGLTVLDAETRNSMLLFWVRNLLRTPLLASDSGSTAVWGSKRINPRPQFCLYLTWSGCSSNDDDDDDGKFSKTIGAERYGILVKCRISVQYLFGSTKCGKLFFMAPNPLFSRQIIFFHLNKL